MAKPKHKTKAEKAHLNKVAELGCVACLKIGFEGTPAELHHIRTFVGAGQKASHYQVIPLCARHHRMDRNAIHQSKVNFEHDFGTEYELLGMVEGLLSSAG